MQTKFHILSILLNFEVEIHLQSYSENKISILNTKILQMIKN